MTDEQEIPVWVTSIYGHHTRQGIVELSVGEHKTQILPEKAREIAHMLIDAAEAAETDEFLMDTFIGVVGLDDRSAAQMLNQFRQARAVRQAKDDS